MIIVPVLRYFYLNRIKHLSNLVKLGASGMYSMTASKIRSHPRRIGNASKVPHLRYAKHGRNGIDSEDYVAQLDAH